MKIAIYSNEREKLRWGMRHFTKCRSRIPDLEAVAYGEQQKLFEALGTQSIDLVMLLASSDSAIGKGAAEKLMGCYKNQPSIFLFGEVEQLFDIAPSNYTSFFNGNYVSVEMGNISYLETSDRKTYVVAGSNKLRVRTNLDLEEQRLPGSQFVRINQGTIVNMEQICSVCGGSVQMKNGSTLHSSRSRKKAFLDKYKRYLYGNCIGLNQI